MTPLNASVFSVLSPRAFLLSSAPSAVCYRLQNMACAQLSSSLRSWAIASPLTRDPANDVNRVPFSPHINPIRNEVALLRSPMFCASLSPSHQSVCCLTGSCAWALSLDGPPPRPLTFASSIDFFKSSSIFLTQSIDVSSAVNLPFEYHAIATNAPKSPRKYSQPI